MATPLLTNSYRAFPYSLPLKYPFKTEAGDVMYVKGFGVKITIKKFTGNGVSAQVVGGADPDAVAFRNMLDAYLEFIHNRAHLSVNAFSHIPAFRVPVEIAANDIATQQMERPFNYLITQDRPPAERIPVIGLLPQLPLNSFSLEVSRTLALKHPALKLKVGDPLADDLGMADDLERIRAVRQLAGDIPLSLDANGAYCAETAPMALELFEPYDISYIEEPVHGLQEMAAVGRETSIPIAADESCTQLQDLDALLDLHEIPVVVIKPTRFGDLPVLYQKAKQLRLGAKQIVISSAMDGEIGLAAAVHFASVLEGAETTPAGFDTAKFL